MKLLFFLLASDFFETEVRPVLAKNCFACHTATALGNLSMSSGDALRKGGNSGPAIVPGKPDESLLIQAVTHTHARLKMPPSGKLSYAEIGALKKWIADGAVWPETSVPKVKTGAGYQITADQRAFWSFQPVRKPTVPAVKEAKSPVDAFLLKAMESKGIRPTTPAPKHVLLRRVYLDLIGIPPTPAEVEAFERNSSPKALESVVETLLSSPRYGERWARHWLDVARYTDDKLNIVADEPYANSFRFRDWVVKAFNDDMPYDLFVKAQLAADLLPVKDREPLLAGLGFYGMSAQYQEDRPDVTGKAFLGLTVGCAQCHDHKFDPIPTKDYYSWLGIFTNTRLKEYPLANESTVAEYQKKEKEVEELQKELDRFRQSQSRLLAEILAARIEKYIPAAYEVMGPRKSTVPDAAKAAGLDEGVLQRWVDYLGRKDHEGDYLKNWQKLLADGGNARKVGEALQAEVLTLHTEIRGIEEKNLATLGGAEGNPALAKIVLLPYPRDKYVFWAGLFGDSRTGFTNRKDARVLQFAGDDLDRFLHGPWKEYSQELKAKLEAKKKELPTKYPFLHIVEEVEKPKNMQVHIRGNADTLGEEAPRAFLSILSPESPVPFTKGSGRLELAEAIASPKNPLTARVMVNRIWAQHFGSGIVRTPSNFGQLGDRPSNQELLDYLAARFVETGWSVKAIHREIVLSSAYALSAQPVEANMKVDAENRLVWRANVRRLDVEALRDSVLAVAGTLDPAVGGPPTPINDEKNHRRTIYSFVSRRKLDATLATFDFPNANDSSEQRILTNTPLQRLYLLNSKFVMNQSRAFADRVKEVSPAASVKQAYRLALNRPPSADELRWGQEYLASGEPLSSLAQAIFSSNEFLYVQ
jgi:hypothetical protein